MKLQKQQQHNLTDIFVGSQKTAVKTDTHDIYIFYLYT